MTSLPRVSSVGFGTHNPAHCAEVIDEHGSELRNNVAAPHRSQPGHSLARPELSHPSGPFPPPGVVDYSGCSIVIGGRRGRTHRPDQRPALTG
jgi:hypothetical protein